MKLEDTWHIYIYIYLYPCPVILLYQTHTFHRPRLLAAPGQVSRCRRAGGAVAAVGAGALWRHAERGAQRCDGRVQWSGDVGK